MKIFALNLCLQFEVQDAARSYHFHSISLEELLTQVKNSSIAPDSQVYIQAVQGKKLDKELFSIQGNEQFRESGLTLTFVFPGRHEMDQTLRDFISHFKPIAAAGGLVVNEKKEYLCIFNQGKWTLPKGKIEANESPVEAAAREVQEETGLKKLQVEDKLCETYHTYPHRDVWMLKTTHWYRMRSDSSETLAPQIEESIEAVAWISRSRWLEIAKNSFPQTRELFEAEFIREMYADR
jgi:ADP-ribose pyrophosphatase YjhB (NUDIX family)